MCPHTLQGYDVSHRPKLVSPVVEKMLDMSKAHLATYQRIVQFCPTFGPHLEKAMCDVYRCVLRALTRMCQLPKPSPNVLTPGGGSGGNSTPRDTTPRFAANGPHRKTQSEMTSSRFTPVGAGEGPLAAGQHNRAASQVPNNYCTPTASPQQLSTAGTPGLCLAFCTTAMHCCFVLCNLKISLLWGVGG